MKPAAKKAMPVKSNKGGAVRGQDRAAMVKKAVPGKSASGKSRKP